MRVSSDESSRLVERLLGLGVRTVLQYYRDRASVLGVCIFVAYLIILVGTVVIKPQTDWDLLAYIAIAAENVHTTPEALHNYAYALLRANTSAAEFIALTSDDGYRTAMFNDPIGFASMLGMYRVKWLYVELLTWLQPLGSPIMAIRMISAVSAGSFALVGLFWLRFAKALMLAPVFVALLIVSGFADMARMTSPDMLFGTLLLSGLFAYVRKWELGAALLLFAAFLVRPDNLVFLAVFAAMLAVFRQWSWGIFAALAGASIAFVPISIASGEPGWWTHLYFASVQHSLTLNDFHPPFSVTVYLEAFLKQALLAVTSQNWVGVAFLVICCWIAVDRLDAPVERRTRVLMTAVVLGIAAKFVVFPVYDARIYFPYIVALFLGCAPGLAHLRSAVMGKLETRGEPYRS